MLKSIRSFLRSCLVGLLFLVLIRPAWAAVSYTTPYSFTTLAGVSTVGSNDGPNGRFYNPSGIAADAAGNIYVADSSNDTIRKVTPAGVVSTVAGLAGIYGSADGSAAVARFHGPTGIVVDRTGNVYVADLGNHTIRKITPAGVVTTLAGTAGAHGLVNGSGSAVRFFNPADLAIDSAGNLYVNDTGNHAIRKVTPDGVVSTVASDPESDSRWAASLGAYDYYSDHNQGLVFKINGIAVDADGNVLVSDTGMTLSSFSAVPGNYTAFRKITPAGIMTILPGPPTGNPAMPGHLVVDASGQLIVAGLTALQKIAADGTVTLLAGTVVTSAGGFPYFLDGPADKSRLWASTGLTIDTAGNIFLTDYSNAVRKLSPAGVVSTVAGMPRALAEQSIDGTGSAARFVGPMGVALDQARNAYTIDFLANTVRKITPAGVVTTFAGPNRSASDSTPLFHGPQQLAIDVSGNVYVADSLAETIIKITPTGESSVLAGKNDESGSADGTGANARFSNPYGIAVDASGNIYVSDRVNSTIRRITPAGVVTTLAGRSGSPGYQDGPGTTALFYGPRGLAVDSGGNVYVADTGNCAIRKITPGGVVTTVAGSQSVVFSINDGPVATASFDTLGSVAIDATGNIFATDLCVIRKITPAGEVSTLGGMVNVSGSADGTGSDARLSDVAYGIAVDPAGILYFSDSSTIRQGQPASLPVIATQPLGQTAAPGANVQFSVVASAAPAPSYQWYFNGTVFSGATTNTLSLTNARSADAGDYTVVVTNSLGSVTSTKATLVVSSAPATPPSTAGSSGGGAIEIRFLLALILLVGARGASCLKRERCPRR